VSLSFNADLVINRHKLLQSVGDEDYRNRLSRVLESHKDGEITSAEILDLKDTEVTLVAAPGAGKVLQFLGAFSWLDNGTDYLNGHADGVRVAYASGAAVGTLATQAQMILSADGYTTSVPINGVALANTALVATVSTTEFDTGTGTLKYRLFYRTIKIAEIVA